MRKKTIKSMPVFLQVVISSLLLVIYSGVFLIYSNIGFNLTVNLLQLGLKNGIPRDVMREYNYLKSVLDKPSKKAKTVTNGLSNFEASEWPVMTLSLASYGMRNLSLKDPFLKEEIVGYLKKTVERAKCPEYYNFIIEHYGDPFRDEKIEDNAFYLGHFMLIVALYREVSGKDDYDELFHKLAFGFYENFRQSPTLCLTSYPDLTWTSEQVVPFRALKIHDDIFGTNYQEVIYKWQDLMKEKFMPSETGLLITMLDKNSGEILQGERTIPNAWTILFLHDILPDFCRSLYENMKRELLIQRLGFPMFKEWVGEVQHSTPDTGPIIWDASVASTGFGIGSAAIMADEAVFYPARYLTDILALAVTFNGKRKYLIGGQVGTAGMFWVKTMGILSDSQSRRLPFKNLIFIYLVISVMILLSFWRLTMNFINLKRILKKQARK